VIIPQISFNITRADTKLTDNVLHIQGLSESLEEEIK
jgi:hypothetical protein